MTLPAETSPDESHLWALHYAYNQLRVLPIKPGEKRPPMAAWQNAATTDPAIVDAWWTELYRGHGVGIATGRGSGVFVLDVDVADGKAGDETLAELEATHGPLPDTWTAITGSGGTHYYFALPPGVEIRNDAGRRLGPGLDIRGEGGQVVAPPTMGRLQRYEWERDVDTPLADPPGWLLELLTATAEAPTPPPAQPVDDGDSVAARYNARTTWAELLGRDGWTLAATLPDGEQHWTRPGKEVREGISATTGHGGGGQLQVFTSSLPWLPEGAYSRFGYYACAEHSGDRSAAARALYEIDMAPVDAVLDAVPVVETHDEPETVQLIPNRVELAHLVDWGRFWSDDHADEEWLAYPVIPKGRAVSLYAPAKAGKSTIVLAVAAAVATGRKVLGQRRHERTSVLYLDYEMTQADLQERLLELGYGPDDDLSLLHYALLPSLPPLDSVEGATAVLALIDLTGAELVVVDTFGRAVEGDEDSADTVRAFYRHTGLTLKARGVTYLRTDHSGKDVAKGQRGSSAKNDDVDLVWRLTRTDSKKGQGVRMERTHSRISWVPDELKISRIETAEGYDYILDVDSRTYPDGTASDMELMKAHGITAEDSKNEARRRMAGILTRKRVDNAYSMLRDAKAKRDEFDELLEAQARRRGENQPGAVPRQEKPGAVASKPGAVGAPYSHKGSQLGAMDEAVGALAASPLGAPPPYKGGAPGPASHEVDIDPMADLF